MVIASCDPGYSKPHAFSIFKSGQLQNFALLDNYPDIYDLMIRWGVEKVFIEDQFFSVNPKTLKDLARETGKICGVLEILETPYEFIMPKKWQSWHKLPLRPKDLSVYKWKKIHAQQQIDLANKYSPKLIISDDVAASVLLGIFAVRSDND